MRPPIMWIAVGFGTGLWAGLGVFGDVGTWHGALVSIPVLLGAAALARRAPGAAAIGVAAVAGLLWGESATRARAATCAGRWARQRGTRTVAAVVRLLDPAPASGGVVDGAVTAGACGGTVRVRWPEGTAGRGGAAYAVAGRWLGSVDRGVLAVRRVRLLDARPRGRGAWRGRVAERSAALFGARAPLVDALVIARRAELDTATRERYSRSGLAHILSISG